MGFGILELLVLLSVLAGVIGGLWLLLSLLGRALGRGDDTRVQALEERVRELEQSQNPAKRA